MAIQRPPGFNETINLYTMGTRQFGQSRLGYKLPISYSTLNNSYRSTIDRRPSYAKGAVITLPGGSTFRRSTSYSRESWEVGDFQPAYAYGRYNNRIYDVTDSGIDGLVFIADQPVLQGMTIATDVRNEVVTKALNKIADQKVNIGENLATLRQTLGMFGGNIRGIVNLAQSMKSRREFRHFLRRSYRDLRRDGVPKRVAEKYLEYIYGFKPLMNDAFALHQMMKDTSVEPLLLHARGNASRSMSGPRGSERSGSYSKSYRDDWSHTSKAKCRLTARIDPNYSGLRALNQLGLLNPVSLAWELVPWSFVVDWLLPIGPVLQALSAPAGLIFVDGSISNRVSETHNVYYGIDTSTIKESRMQIYERAIVPIKYEGYRRSALGQWPIPGLWIDQDPLRGDRWLKALALAIANLR